MLKGNKLLISLSLACVVAIIIMIVALCVPSNKANEKPFTPPSFDNDAIEGTPSVPENSGYKVLYQDGMSFKVGVCGKVNVHGKTADIYLTNLEENEVWLKARFYDSNKNVVGESGLIKPGEYLKSVELKKELKASEQYTIKIMSYEPNTYNSLGAVTLNPKIVIAQ